MLEQQVDQRLATLAPDRRVQQIRVLVRERRIDEAARPERERLPSRPPRPAPGVRPARSVPRACSGWPSTALNSASCGVGIIAQCDPRNCTEAGQDLVAPVREIASDTVAIQHRRDSVGIPRR